MKYTLGHLKACLDALKTVWDTKAVLGVDGEPEYVECTDFSITQNEEGRFEVFCITIINDHSVGQSWGEVDDDDWLEEENDTNAKSPYFVARKIVLSCVGKYIDDRFEDGLCGEDEPLCNGHCLTLDDIGVSGNGIAYSHPECPLHKSGCPLS